MRCPACLDTKWLVDLEAEPEGIHRTLPSETTRFRAHFGVGLLGLAGAGTAASSGSFGVAEVLLLPTLLALGAAALAAPPARPSSRWSILAGPVARARAARMTFTGIVQAARGVKLLRSPLRDVVCSAYRLAGDAGDMPIDDARGRPFDLLIEGGERIRVEAQVATLDLPVREADDRVPLPKGRAVFLRHRGVASVEAARVTEATLAIGARVVVTGAVREETVAAGYRTTRASRTLYDAPGAPLLIRPASETRTANRESGGPDA